MSTRAVQICLDGSDEVATKEGELQSFDEFVRVSAAEQGLLGQAQAADILGVTRQRVGDLVDAGTLASWDFMGRRYVSVRQVVERRRAELKAGRPARLTVAKAKVAAKVIAKNTPAQWAASVLQGK